MKADVAIVGTGPAGLMAASVIAEKGYSVCIFDKKPGPGRKFLIAGSSGLNITYDHPVETFHQFYQGPTHLIQKTVQAFPPEKWISFIENLGISTFKGTSHRYFVKGLKASTLLRAWLRSLEKNGAQTFYNHECTDFKVKQNSIELSFSNQSSYEFKAVCFAFGGASYEKKETPLRWPEFLKNKNLTFQEFLPSNVGYEVDWPASLFKEAEGLPLKDVIFSTAKGSKQGDLTVTSYGLEGTPVYFYGTPGQGTIDFKPELTFEKVLEKLSRVKENLSPIRRVQKTLNLNPAALALLFHAAPQQTRSDIQAMAKAIKSFPLTLKQPRPIQEAISSNGGIEGHELDDNLMLKKYPGIYLAGEMLNWNAPTGGFLIQACVSQGFVAGKAILNQLSS